MNIRLLKAIAFTSLVICFSCKSGIKQDAIFLWDIVSASSPQAIDLNADGIKDIIMGAGGEEWAKTDKGIIAIDGASFKLLWSAPARNQMVGSPVFLDINQDGTPDVIIGGRSAELQALDGKSGTKIWEFYDKSGSIISIDDGWYNFYNPQIIKDQNNDGIADIIICNGGNALLPPKSRYREAGRLMLISGATGKVLADDKMPDGQETYFSPVLLDSESENPSIIYGSGGETKPGHLYLCKLSDLKNKQLNKSLVIDSTISKGYEAPPVLADFNLDGKSDIVINTAEGTTKLIDGITFKLIWEVSQDSAETFSQPAIGYFYGNDNIPDVFVQYAIGTYPKYKSTIQLLIDGKTGQIVEKYEGLRFTFSSPLVADINMDGTDEVILSTTIDQKKNGKVLPVFFLASYDFKNQKVNELTGYKEGANFTSTPYMGDLNDNGKIDIVFTGSPTVNSIFPGNSPYEIVRNRLDIYKIELPKTNASFVKWGSYMGPDSRSHWRVNVAP